MSKSPRDDGKATEKGKTRVSHMLGETDGGHEQGEEMERGNRRECWGRIGKLNTQSETKHIPPPDNKSNMGTIKAYQGIWKDNVK